MGNWIKKINKKREENIKREQKKKRINLISDEVIKNCMCSLGLFILVLACTIISFVYPNNEDSANMGLVLAMMSLFVTFAFEGYEWIKLFNKNSKGTSTFPFFVAYGLIIILTIIKVNTNIWNKIIDYTNFLCATPLLIYIILATIRTSISNLKNETKN